MINNNNYIIDLQYFGTVESYSNLIGKTNVFFLKDLRYEKSLHPNRIFLGGSNGPLLLSIPLVGGRNKKQLLSEVEMSNNENWKKNHWRAIYTVYKKSPWFDEYAPSLEGLFQTNDQFLAEWNLKTMKWALTAMKLKLDILSLNFSEFNSEIHKTNSYPIIPVNEFYPSYQQVFMDRQGFIANLSILDLLFCCGPSSVEYLSKLFSNRSV